MRGHKRSRNELQQSSSKSDLSSRFAYSGLSTSRLHPSFDPIPRRPTCFLLLQNAPGQLASFAGAPVWLKPLLYIQHQHGHSEKWLCGLFRDLPAGLMKEIRTAFFAVAILVLNRMRSVESTSTLIRDAARADDKLTEEPWNHDDLGLSDEDLHTFHVANFGVIRYPTAITA